MEKSTYFQEEKTLEERKEESARMSKRYPDRICIIVQRSKRASEGTPTIDRRKFMACNDMKFGHFQNIIRKRLNMEKEEALITFINDNTLPIHSQQVGELFQEHKSEDNFLYVYYTKENTFG